MGKFDTPENITYTPAPDDRLTADDAAFLHQALIEHGFGSFDDSVQDAKTAKMTVTFTFKYHSQVVDFCKRLKKK